MKRIDLHMHTCFCDGKDTPEQMILAAAALNMDAVGVCVHSHTAFDESYCASEAGIKEFLREMAFMKEKYKDRIPVFAGLEQDLYSDTDPEGFDYLIGSVHYLKIKDRYYPIDKDEETFVRIAEEQFCGDYFAFAEAYYEETATVLAVTKADFVGHFDLVAKYNEDGKLFDMRDPRYLTAAEKCIDALIPYGKPFEINTGAMAKGYRTEPYPDKYLYDRIRQKGGRFLINSDAHRKENLMFAFDRYADLAEDAAYGLVLKKQ